MLHSHPKNIALTIVPITYPDTYLGGTRQARKHAPYPQVPIKGHKKYYHLSGVSLGTFKININYYNLWYF